MTRLVALKLSEHATARILCFPYAGGHSAFAAAWSRHLPDSVELFGVGYPAATAHAPRTVQSIVSAVVGEVLALNNVPLILFGYSLGTLVAYELCVALARCNAGLPAELVVAARGAPHHGSKKQPMSQLPDEEFIARLREFGGTPPSVLENPEVLSFFMPVLRADLLTAESYQHTPATPLACPVSAIFGSTDSTTTGAAVADWEAYTSGGFRLHSVAGHHFFMQQQPQAVIGILREVVTRHAQSTTAVSA